MAVVFSKINTSKLNTSKVNGDTLLKLIKASSNQSLLNWQEKTFIDNLDRQIRTSKSFSFSYDDIQKLRQITMAICWEF